MGTLATRSREIGKIVDLITDIAKQIHLLALNASIEASRSGEAGRRFAVVAAEVKELANKTTQSADDISRLIGGIQHSSGESADAIQQLSTIVQRVDQLTATIASSVEQQNATQLHLRQPDQHRRQRRGGQPLDERLRRRLRLHLGAGVLGAPGLAGARRAVGADAAGGGAV